ncbi:MAG TPA: lysophospholipid acyltransferase family protein, partial [Acidobacteriaceae bacterium]
PLPPGPLLLIANHVTAVDGALVLYALPPSLRRHLAAAMSAEMLLDFRHARGQRTWLHTALAPAAYWLLTALFNVFPLPRLQGFRHSFAHAGRALDRGYSVLLFPEGHRSRSGLLQDFRPGIGLLAQQSRVPVLPIALLGLGTAPGQAGRARSWFRSGRIQIRLGAPIQLPDHASPSDWTTTLQAALLRLLTHPGPPPAPPASN